ncbi:MAG: MFS transporter, partial [Syntrophales bacterium LBB04]|nr:MFS transporter [Syntrophales bacterium LBB04]
IMFPPWTPGAPYSVFLGPIAKDLHWQRGAAGIAFSIVLIMGAPLGLLIGKIIDRYGPQKIMALEVIFCSAAFLLASTMQELWHLYLSLGILEGCAFAGAYLIPTATTARWFDKNRGLALSIVMSGSGLAYIIGPPLTVKLMEAYGWRDTFLIYSAGVAMLGILPALVLRNPSAASLKREADSPAGPFTQEAAAPLITLRSAACTSTLWMLIIIWLTQSFAQMMFVLHVVPLNVDKGIGLAVAAGAMSFYGLGLLGGRMVSGPLADRIGALTVVLGTMFLSSLGLLIVVAAHELPLLYGATFLFGLALAGADTAYVRALPDIVGTSAIGVLMGVFNLGWRIGGAVGPVLAGFLFDATHVYAIPFGIAIAGLLLGGGLFWAASRPERNLERILAKKRDQLL